MSTGAARRGSFDQRACFRLGACLPCNISSGGISTQAYLLDISLSGASISSRQPLGNGNFVSIVVHLPTLNKDLTLQGFIVHVASHRSDKSKEVFNYGVRFNSACSDSLVLIKTLMPKNHAR